MPCLECTIDPKVREGLRRPLTPDELADVPPKHHSLLNTHKTCFSYGTTTRSNFCVADEVPLGRTLGLLLTHQVQPDKDANLCCPGEIRGQRFDRCVTRIHLLVYDVDGGINLEKLLKLCQRFGFLLVGYTTYNHLADGKTEKYRIVIALAEPIDMDEVGQHGYRAIYMAVGKRLFAGKPFDACCKNPSRGFYFPAHHPERADKYQSFLQYGPLFDWRCTWHALKEALEKDRTEQQKRAEERQAMRLLQSTDEVISQISEYLKHISAFHRETWFKVICAIMHETECSTEGRQLAHDWSATVPEKYDYDDLERVLNSIENSNHPHPANMRTLERLSRPKTHASVPAVNPPRNFSPIW